MFLEVAHPSRATEQRLEGLVSRPRPLDECAHQQIEGVRARQAALPSPPPTPPPSPPRSLDDSRGTVTGASATMAACAANGSRA